MSLRDKNRKKRAPKRSERPAETDSKTKQKPRGRVNAYFTHHLWVLVSSLGVLWRTPFATFMTAAVIGIALALPAGLHVLLSNVQKLSTGWEDTAQVSLFMKQGVPESRILALADTLRGWDGVAEVRYISPEAALAEFQENSGLGEALDALLENPLPAVLILQPTSEQAQPARMELLLGRLRKIDAVDLAQLDMEWVRRLNAIIEVGKRGVLLLTALLALAILLVVGNTIRLTIFNRRQEIVVTKLIGATNAFIRRPFLYTGFWYGLMGAILAWLLVGSFMGLLSGPVSHLAALYNSQFVLSGLNFDTIGGLLGIGILLGLLGSWIAVGRHLSEIEPE
jgi:cell division transport system permease protein